MREAVGWWRMLEAGCRGQRVWCQRPARGIRHPKYAPCATLRDMLGRPRRSPVRCAPLAAPAAATAASEMGVRQPGGCWRPERVPLAAAVRAACHGGCHCGGSCVWARAPLPTPPPLLPPPSGVPAGTWPREGGRASRGACSCDSATHPCSDDGWVVGSIDVQHVGW